jgi:preprotein translocase subunit SecA
MDRLYRFLGLTVGVIAPGLDHAGRKVAYSSDITYATSNELGLDNLRDNLKSRIEDCVQRPLNYAVIGEIDSILIDEARAPLVISVPTEESTEKYDRINRIISHMDLGKALRDLYAERKRLEQIITALQELSFSRATPLEISMTVRKGRHRRGSRKYCWMTTKRHWLGRPS